MEKAVEIFSGFSRTLRQLFCAVLAVALCVTSYVVHAQEAVQKARQGQHVHSKIIRYHLLQEQFARAIVPTEIAIPPLANGDFSSYKNYLSSAYPNTIPLLSPDKNQSPFLIKKYNVGLKAFVGYPSYLEPQIAPSPQDIAAAKIKFREIASNLIAEKKFLQVQVSETEKDANIFLIPVTSRTYINIVNPNFRVDPLIRENYLNVLSGISQIFFNQNVFLLNEQGLKGTYLNDEKGNILVSFCPVDISKDEENIRKNLFYCFVQSQGFPGFYRSHPMLDQDALFWSDRLISAMHCPSINRNKSIYDINFESVARECSIMGW